MLHSHPELLCSFATLTRNHMANTNIATARTTSGTKRYRATRNSVHVALMIPRSLCSVAAHAHVSVVLNPEPGEDDATARLCATKVYIITISDKTSDKGKTVPVPDLLRPLHYLSMYVRTHVVPLIDVPD
jgi:hypothetical protein